MYTDISGLLNKVENGGTTAKGKVTASEFNSLVAAVIENQSAIRSVTFNSGSKIFPDEEGNVNIIATENNYLLQLTAVPQLELIDGAYQIALGNPFVIDMTLSHKYVEGSEHIDVTTPCYAEYYVNGSVVATQTMFNGNTYSYDFSKHLKVGDNQIYVKVKNDFGNEYTTRVFGVTAIYLEILLPNFDQKITQSGDWVLDVQLLGSDGIVQISIDGTIVAGEEQTANSVISYNIQKGNSHGAHVLEVNAFSVSNTKIAAVPVKLEYLYNDGVNTDPIIATTILQNHSVSIYDILRFDYWASLNSETYPITKQVQVQFQNADGTLVNQTNNTLTFANNTSNILTYEYVLMDKTLVGTKQIKITIDTIEKIIPITIEPSDVDLKETTGYALKLDSTGRSNSDLNKDDWSYGDYSISFPDNFEFSDIGSGWRKDADGNTGLYIKRGQRISLNYKLFDREFGMANSDIQQSTGKTFSFEFMVTNCIKKDTPVIDCVDSRGYGFRVNTNKASMFIEGFSGAVIDGVKNDASVTFKEDSRIRLDVVIEGKPKDYTWYDYENETNVTNSRTSMFMYVNGVYQTAFQLSDVYLFKQQTPVDITIGSDYCDFFLYTIRAYDSALSDNNIIDNYAYDRPQVGSKIEVAKRNDVYDYKGDVDYDKLRVARPDLPVMIWEFEKMPVDKDNWLDLASTVFDNPLNESDWEKGLASFTHSKARFKNQGTSSMSYPIPFRNYDFRYDKGVFTMTDGTTQTEYHLYPSMPGAVRFTFKKDFASSEMANNAITSMLWNEMTKGIGEDYPDVLTKAQQDMGADDPTYRQANFAEPVYVFIKNPVGSEMVPLGMFNLINWKNDHKYLGFDAYTWEKDRAQCWEYAQNDDYFTRTLAAPYWDPEIKDDKGATVGGVVNDIDGVYEARYPKNSPTNKTAAGDDIDFGYGDLESHITAMADESKDIRRLHNWLYSTDQRHATNAVLTQSYTDKHGTIHRIDNREYRLRKFETEVGDYLIVDSCLAYLLWKEVLHMCDSGIKNLNLWTMDGTHWGCMVRDADTGLGINNRGILSYPYYLETTDWANDDAGSILYLNAGHFDEEILASGVPEGYQYTMAGQNAPLWLNLEMLYRDRLINLYQRLVSLSNVTKFNAKPLINWFNSHQGKWAEALYNYGKLQYITPTQANYQKAQGNKQSQREDWLTNAFYYRTSKYGAPEAAAFRLTGAGSDLLIKTYIPLYVAMSPVSLVYDSSVRRIRCVNPEEGVVYPNPFSSGATDQGYVYIYNPRLITDLGNLYEFSQNWASIDMTPFVRLRYLRLGNHEDPAYTASLSTIDLSKCVALEYIDLTGIGNLSGNLDLRQNVQLKQFYAQRSSLSRINFPQTSTITDIEVGAYLVELNLTNVPNLQHFAIELPELIETLILKNCGGSVVDSYSIVRDNYHADKTLKNVDIEDVEWTSCELGVLTYLLSIGAKITGHIVMETGSVISADVKRQMLTLWGEVDDPTNDLYVEYDFVNTTAINYEGETAFYLLGDYQLEFGVTPATANSFSNVTWTAPNSSYATISSDGILSVTRQASEGSTPQLDVTVTVTDAATGSKLSVTQRISFYQPDAKYGDYVYSDGTYSTVLNKSKEVVGVCMWIDATNPSNRIMVGCDSANIPGGAVFYQGTTVWQTTWDGTVAMSASNYFTKDTFDDFCRDSLQSDGFKVFTAGVLSQTEEAFDIHRAHAEYRQNQLQVLFDEGNITKIPTTYEEAYEQYLYRANQDGQYTETRGKIGYSDFYMNSYQPSASNLTDKFKAGNWVWCAPALLLKLEWHRYFGGLDAIDNNLMTLPSTRANYSATGYFSQDYSTKMLTAGIYSNPATNNILALNYQDNSFRPVKLMCKF